MLVQSLKEMNAALSYINFVLTLAPCTHYLLVTQGHLKGIFFNSGKILPTRATYISIKTMDRLLLSHQIQH